MFRRHSPVDHILSQYLGSLQPAPSFSLAREQGLTTLRFSSLDSTMKTSSQLGPSLLSLCKGETFSFVAERQSQGRGQRDNKWYSPVGNLYCTFLFELPRAGLLPVLPFLGTSCLLRTLWPLLPQKHLQVKWVNDLFLEGKKVGGVLVSTDVLGQEVLVSLGVGLNVEEAMEGATSLRQEGCSLSVEQVYSTLSHHLQKALAEEVRPQDLNGCMMHLDEEVLIMDAALQEELLRGTFRGVDAEGRALLEREGRLQTVSTGRMRPLDFI